MKKAQLILLLLILFSSTSCKGKDKNMKERLDYRWEPTVSVPHNYPVTVFRGILTSGERGGADIMDDDFMNNEWGEPSHGSWGIESSSIPNGVGIKWYSFADDKFYRGFFDLPYDTLKALMTKKFTGAETKEPEAHYTHIIVGMAPRGIVSVWLHGDGVTTEIGIYQADEVELDMVKEIPSGMQDYYRNYTSKDSVRLDWRNSLIAEYPDAKATIEKPIPEGLWDKTYREKFDSRVLINLADSSGILDMMTMSYLNGERQTLMYEAMKENLFSKKPRFKGLRFRWSFGRELRESELKLDADEVLEAYKRVSANEPQDRKYELRVDVNATNDYIRVYLQAVGSEYPKDIELEKSKIRIYPMSDYYQYLFDVFRNEYEDDPNLRMIRKDGK